ncbi:MAG: hypothetical protein GKR92_10510 [Gammaproteobacteria bacterium]|nr:MAG: hypothetical protein GKR92_10510 [Gammaproteobacteria bacterium]
MGRNKSDRLRQALAFETAKIITEEGVRDFHRAKLKASERLGNSEHGSLPSNFEIEQAIASFQKTFIPTHEQILLVERQIALAVMEWLKDYAPFLVGPVLEGTLGVNTPISIHVSCDTVERIIDVLQDKNVALKFSEQRLKLNNDFVFLPTVNFEYQDNEIEVSVFNLRQQHQLPKSKSQNRSIQRINLKGLKELLAE